MTIQDPENDERATLIDELLARQDEVIRGLEDLEQRLIATIEECRPPKEESDEEADSAETAKPPARKAA